MASLHLQQPRAAMSMEDLPCYVLSNIFIRLLAKQLAQMRSVSKSWNTLLSEKTFIKSHLNHSINNNDEVLLFFYRELDDFGEPFSAHPSRSPNLKLTNFIKPPVEQQHISVIGSVNGLICYCYLSDNDDHYVLQIWNPSLSAVLTLPSHALPSPNYGFGFGFGFDPKVDDYKVVKLTKLCGKLGKTRPFDWSRLLATHLSVVRESLQVEVYSMRKGSWKLITQSFPSHITSIIIFPQVNVCVDGLIHWLGYINEENKETILAYDLGAETFHEIPLPDSILLHNNASNHHINELGVLAGKLCVMSYVEEGECEVWVMDEYGVVESWFKHHAFSQFRNIEPFGFTLHNEFLFEKIDGDDEDDDGYLRFGLFDPVAAKTKFFKVPETRKVVGYLDSLVWVAPDDECEMVKYRGSGLHHVWFPVMSIASIALAIAFTVARR